MLGPLDATLVLVVLRIVPRNTPRPTMRIITITMRAETPREIALFALANESQKRMMPSVLFETMR